MFTSALSGFGTSAGLILTIGAQNAFVLRQGIRREHVFWVCLLAACSDALLIAAGVAGAGVILQAMPAFETVMRVVGAAFLGVYGLLSLHRAWRGGQAMVATESPAQETLRSTMMTCLALTWLNPHVYLDTLGLVGSIGAQDPLPQAFAAGAMTASFVFFFSLGFGARLAAPIFARPSAWRVLDVLVAAMVWTVAWWLVVSSPALTLPQ